MRDRFYVAGIGASAGGLEALRELLHALPAHSGLAYRDLPAPGTHLRESTGGDSVARDSGSGGSGGRRPGRGAGSRFRASSEYRDGDTRGKLAQVSMESVLSTVLLNLHLAIESSHAVITFDPLPVIRADETQLLRLLQNLLSNSTKYRGAEPPPIHLSAREAARRSIYSLFLRDSMAANIRGGGSD